MVINFSQRCGNGWYTDILSRNSRYFPGIFSVFSWYFCFFFSVFLGIFPVFFRYFPGIFAFFVGIFSVFFSVFLGIFFRILRYFLGIFLVFISILFGLLCFFNVFPGFFFKLLVFFSTFSFFFSNFSRWKSGVIVHFFVPTLAAFLFESDQNLQNLINFRGFFSVLCLLWRQLFCEKICLIRAYYRGLI